MRQTLPFEIKEVSGKEIIGHGSVFGNVDLGGDVVLPGAFKRTLAAHRKAGTMPAMLWQHDHEKPIGVWHEMSEDGDGLFMRGEFADTAEGRDARTLAKMKAVRGLSIGFRLMEFDFDRDGNRLLKEIDLWETSVVTFPMNPAAQIEAVKSQCPDPRSFERFLRDAGVSQKSARDIVHDVLGSNVRLDDEDQCEADEDVAKAMAALNERLVAERIRNFTATLRR